MATAVTNIGGGPVRGLEGLKTLDKASARQILEGVATQISGKSGVLKLMHTTKNSDMVFERKSTWQFYARRDSKMEATATALRTIVEKAGLSEDAQKAIKGYLTDNNNRVGGTAFADLIRQHLGEEELPGNVDAAPPGATFDAEPRVMAGDAESPSLPDEPIAQDSTVAQLPDKPVVQESVVAQPRVDDSVVVPLSDKPVVEVAEDPFKPAIAEEMLAFLPDKCPKADRETVQRIADSLRALPSALPAEDGVIALDKPLKLPPGSVINLAANEIDLSGLEASNAIIRLEGNNISLGQPIKLENCRIILAPRAEDGILMGRMAQDDHFRPAMLKSVIFDLDPQSDLRSMDVKRYYSSACNQSISSLSPNEADIAQHYVNQISVNLKVGFTGANADRAILAALGKFESLKIPPELKQNLNAHVMSNWLANRDFSAQHKLLAFENYADQLEGLVLSPKFIADFLSGLVAKGDQPDADRAAALRGRVIANIDWSKRDAASLLRSAKLKEEDMDAWLIALQDQWPTLSEEKQGALANSIIFVRERLKEEMMDALLDQWPTLSEEKQRAYANSIIFVRDCLPAVLKDGTPEQQRKAADIRDTLRSITDYSSPVGAMIFAESPQLHDDQDKLRKVFSQDTKNDVVATALKKLVDMEGGKEKFGPFIKEFLNDDLTVLFQRPNARIRRAAAVS